MGILSFFNRYFLDRSFSCCFPCQWGECHYIDFCAGYVAEGCSLTLHSGVGAGSLTGLHVGGSGGRLEFLITGEPLEQVRKLTDFSLLVFVAG